MQDTPKNAAAFGRSSNQHGKGAWALARFVALVEYRLREPGGDGAGEIYRLITTLLDESAAGARKLAELYPERWEIELTIKEGKSIFRKGQVTLRSKPPELVRQEFWGLLLAHYLVRRMMTEAASGQGIDPDTLSYRRSVEIIKSAQGCPVLAIPAKTRKTALANAMKRIGEAKAVSSRGTSKERTIKKKPKCSFPPRKSGHKPVTRKRTAKVDVDFGAK